MDKTVTSFNTLKSLISRGSSSNQSADDFSQSVPRSDDRGPIAAPIGTAVTPFPAEHLQQMIAAYESGATLAAIGRDWQLGKQTVRRMLTEVGIRVRRQGLDDEQTAHAVRSYESGSTTREIARELGVGHSMVWRALKRAGVELRSQVQRRGGTSSGR